ncbi:MAG: hypothetical protein ABI707_07910 [Ferruginibacter sp.]
MKDFVKASFIIILSNILTGCSNKTFPTGNFQEKPVTVDGDLNEWDQPIRFVSSGGQVLYNVTNDNDNIYVALETHDEATALKILRAGVNIYIDPAAGESKDICLAFPLANTSSSPSKNRNTGGTKPGRNEMRESLLIQAISFNATGFKNMENRLYDVSDKSKIKVAIKPGDNSSLGYEAVIPIQYIFGNSPGSKNSVRNVSVGVVINATRNTENNSRTNVSGSGQRHGGGRGAGGRMGGGGGGNYRRNNTTGDPNLQTSDRSAMAKQDANWYKFKLAVKK